MVDASPRSAPTKAILGISSTFLALSVALFFVRPPRLEVGQAELDDPRVRDQVVGVLATRATGSYDSHNDPQVGRILLPDQKGRTHAFFKIDTNAFGLREHPIELPKPPGRVRVVLLGDSYVFGTGSEQDDRFGVHLEDYLRERSGKEDVEVLHVGILSWNAVSESVYLRRSLSLFQPDLVIHVTLSNDLDDVDGVRGFGGMARFTPQHRERGEGAIHSEHPATRMNLTKVYNPLLFDVDLESRERWGQAREAVTRLATEVERQGGKYLHLFRWPGMYTMARSLLAPTLDDSQVACISAAFTDDPANWVKPDDKHWGPTGMRRIARLCYALIQQRGLLPMLDLPPWPEADEEVRLIHDAGVVETPQGLNAPPHVDAVLDLEHVQDDIWEGGHVYGGLDAEGLMGPFASIVLQNPSAKPKGPPAGKSVHLRASCFDRPEIDGGALRVLVEGLPVGSCTIRANELIDASFPLPAEVADRRFLNVRLEADDWFYQGKDLQQCVSVRLLSVAVEP